MALRGALHLGGAVSDVASDTTAYPHRDALHSLNINAAWLPTESHGGDQISWTRDFFDAVQPHQTGAYLNFLDRDDHEHVRRAFSDGTHRRLVGLKNRYDPDNVFRHNHNISPTGGRPASVGALPQSQSG